jgi:uncharacterized membrane protein YuzA (DUF378 family)
MRLATTAARTVVRAAGLIQIVLGGLFWFDSQLQLIPIHMLVGFLLVIGLWTLAGLGAASGVPLARVVLAVAWGVLVPWLGLNQAEMLGGDYHWLVQVIHLVVGLAAIWQAEGLAVAIGRRRQVAATGGL